MTSHLDATGRMRDEYPGRVRADDGALLSYNVRVPPGSSTRVPGVVLYVNGLSNACFQLTPLADDACARGGRVVVTYDMRGHGMSEDPNDYDSVTATTFARDAWTVVDAARRALSASDADADADADADVTVVTYSFGTRVGLEMIRQRPDAVTCFVSILGSPNRILSGLMPHAAARCVVWASRRLGVRASTAVVGASLRCASTFPYLSHVIGRATGYLKSTYGDFARPFFKSLNRLDAETWVRCVWDGHETGALDVLRTLKSRGVYVGIIAGDKDFAAPLRDMREWAAWANYYVMLPNCAHDGLRSHTREIVSLAREILAGAEKRK